MAEGIPINAVPGMWFTDAGAVAASHKLYTYAAGTTNNQATYSDAALVTANANPIVLDSSGRATVFLNPALGLYKFVLKTAADVTLWTRDNIGGAQPSTTPTLISGTAGEGWSLLAGDTFPLLVYLSDGSGGLTAGRWYKASASNDYSSNDALALGYTQDTAATGGSVTIQLLGRITGLTTRTAGRTYGVGSDDTARYAYMADSTTSGILLPTESASQTTGPLPAINGHSLTGITKIVDTKLSATGNVGVDADELYSSDGVDLYSANTASVADFVRGVFWGIDANNANAKTVTLRFRDDDTIIGPNDNAILAVTMPASEATKWRLSFTLVRTSATTFHSDAYLVGGPANSATTVEVYANTTGSTVAWNGTVGDAYVQITGEATADDDIQLLGGVLTLCTRA